MNQEKLAKLNTLIAEVFSVEEKNVKPEASFVYDLDADSFKRVVFMAEVQDLTGIELDAAQLKYMETVKDLYEALKGWLEA